jgi:hypothetical protein
MRRGFVLFVVATTIAFLAGNGSVQARAIVQADRVQTATTPPIAFETPTVVDPIHTNGEPDIGIDPQGRVFVSGPTGTGTQRSVWLGSVDGGHTFRLVTPCPIAPTPPCPFPNGLMGTTPPPGGGDTDIAFDRSGKQYFADLYALTCFRTATTADGGATVFQSTFGGCAERPGADRQWLTVYDPAPGTPNESAYKGPKPLIYIVYNNATTGTQWNKSNSDVDRTPGGPGLNYEPATNGATSVCKDTIAYAPFGADGYPQIDQVTGKVLQASGFRNGTENYSLLLNVGTPDTAGNLTFLDAPTADKPCGDQSKLIHIADNLKWSPDTLFTVSSMDSARNLFVVFALNAASPTERQIFVSGASADGGVWTSWTPPVRVSDGSTETGDAVNVFPWIKAGGPGRAAAVWYGSDQTGDPSIAKGQQWNVFMSQLVFPTNPGGGLTGAAPTTALVKVTPHPMHYDDICLQGTGCITSQGNRNLADFFVITMDRSGAAEIVYDDTSNGLVQTVGGFVKPSGFLDHPGAGVITIARQSSGPGLFGTNVSGPSNAPVSGLRDPRGDALFPVIGGKNVAGMDILSTELNLSNDGTTLRATTRVLDTRNPRATATTLTGATLLQFVTRWQMGKTIFYAGMENTLANKPSFYAGKAQSIDLCSVSACFPHVLVYPEVPYSGAPKESGLPESGSVSCPASPSTDNPCVIRINVKVADVGSPTASSLLEEVGSYAFATSHPDAVTTNAQAEADSVPLEIDGVCCFNFKADVANGPLPTCTDRHGNGEIKGRESGKASFDFDIDDCKTNDQNFVSEQDRGSNTDFRSSAIQAVVFDEGTRSLTVFGTGTNAGHPVTFTMVAVDNGSAAPGTFSLTLSDGYQVSGTLLSGLIRLL